jgi:hypothetical protein
MQQLTEGSIDFKFNLTKFCNPYSVNKETKKKDNVDSKEIKMNKKLILGLALAVVLVSGSMFSAQAECNFGCLPHFSMPTCFGGCAAKAEEPVRDRDCAGNLITPNGVVQTGGW